MYVITCPIESDKPFLGLADKRFALINRCHNILVKHCIALINRLNRDKDYTSLLSEYKTAKTEAAKLKPGSKARKKADVKVKKITSAMNTYRGSAGLSKTGLETYIAIWQRQHKQHISSHQAQKEAARVYAGVKKVLFGNGKKLHYRKLGDTTTICGKSPQNGISFNRESMTFVWMGETFRLKPVDPDNLYMIAALYPEGRKPLDISYCELKRMMFPNGWHYYLHIYVKGAPPRKHKRGKGIAGIDPGTSTMAVSAEKCAILEELAPEVTKYAKKQKALLRRMDRSRHDSNPDNYNADGTVKKGCHKWKCTEQYKKLAKAYKSLCRAKAAYIRQSHCILANRVVEAARFVYVEAMNYKGLQKRAATTERNDKQSLVTNGKKTKAVYKYKRKKRFGRSLNNRAPAEFLTILKVKLEAVGGFLYEIDTQKFKASQYNHVTDTYIRVPLTSRFKIISGYPVQRDLYSAFLIQHAFCTLDKPDRAACEKDFKHFVRLQNKTIDSMIAQGISKPECFGF